MPEYEFMIIRASALRNGGWTLCLVALVILTAGIKIPVFAQDRATGSTVSELTPRQREIERQRSRMQSSDAEERRDAIMKLGSMRHPDSSRVAAIGLADAIPIIRATAAGAVLALPRKEAVGVLLPLLKDKKEFVRQQVAYALGHVGSSTAVADLITTLVRDKQPGVRAAAAVALGLIADDTASGPLARVLDPGFRLSVNAGVDNKQKREENTFVQRAAARALGQIRSRASVPALILTMHNTHTTNDVRREIAYSLGLIGDMAAVPVLRETLSASDPYLARNAYEALLKLSPSDATMHP